MRAMVYHGLVRVVYERPCMVPGVSLNIALYLFLGGMGAGLYAVWFLNAAAPRRIGSRELPPKKCSGRFALARKRDFCLDSGLEPLLAAGIVACGCLFLLADLGVS